MPRCFHPTTPGTLINIASILALHTLPGSAVYSASKARVLSFTRGLQEEFADSGVRIQAVGCRRRPLPICGRPPAWRWTLCPAAR